MRTNVTRQSGFTLIEMIVFMVVVSIGLATLLLAYNHAVSRGTDPVIRVRLLELAQSRLDDVMARKYDETSPIGGIPACGSAESGAPACGGAIGADSGENSANPASLDDVDDFHNASDTPYTGYTRTVSVAFAGSELGVANNQAKRITVTVTAPNSEQFSLSSYRTNF